MSQAATEHHEDGNWKNLKAAFTKVEDTLKMMKNKLSLKNAKLGDLVKDIDEAIKALGVHRIGWTKEPQKATPLEERMLALEEAVRKSLAHPSRQLGPSVVPGLGAKPSYAAIASAPDTRATIRICVPQAEEKEPAELLSIAKQKFLGAYAVRQMRSNDTEVFLQSTAQRDAALCMDQPEGFKILRQDYHAEVLGVPLNIKITGGKNANNNELIKAICHASRARIPSLEINRIRWLHNNKEQAQAIKKGHSRGSVILSLPTESLQWKVVKYGVVINSILYSAQLWSPRGQVKQCFNCSQWGHTQAVCSKQARCGECAGNHQTRDCPKKRVSCCNCGKEHKSWHKNACHTFQVYKASVERCRGEMMQRTAEIRSHRSSISLNSQEVNSGSKSIPEFTLITKAPKEAKRGPGRPRKEAAAPTTSLIPVPSPTSVKATPQQESTTQAPPTRSSRVNPSTEKLMALYTPNFKI
ncbi:hypothetical protein K3495_g14385 [Podosphaera aphanis]|nr:hypothetical protein K3495_g14385 [Podosphaera aphanis]